MTSARHTRFESIRLRLEAFNPGTGWRLWLYEFLMGWTPPDGIYVP